jgi:hypothetical protein
LKEVDRLPVDIVAQPNSVASTSHHYHGFGVIGYPLFSSLSCRSPAGVPPATASPKET